MTGMGIVCAAGNNSDTSWRHLLSGSVFLKQSTRYAQLGTLPVGEVGDLDLSSIVDVKSLRRAPLFVRYAMAAAHEAYKQAGVGSAYQERARLGASIGTAHGSTLCYLDENPELPVAVRNGTVPRALALYPTAELNNLAGGLVSLKLQLKGPLLAPSSGMLTGIQSIIDGYQVILRHDADMMVCGATDTPLAPLGVAGYHMAGLLAQETYAPYKEQANGFFLGEGACAFMLESRDHAVARSAPILAEVAGYAIRNCPYAQPTAEQWYDTRRATLLHALDRAGVGIEDLSLISFDTWAAKPSDKADLILLADLQECGFRGEHLSIKPQIGVTLGASSIMEAWACVQTLNQQSGSAAAAVIASDPSGAVSALVLKTYERNSIH